MFRLSYLWLVCLYTILLALSNIKFCHNKFPKLNWFISYPSHASKGPWFLLDENSRHNSLDPTFITVMVVYFWEFPVDRPRKYIFFKSRVIMSLHQHFLTSALLTFGAS